MAAFTYVELLIASAVLIILVTGLVSSNLFGMRMEQIVVQRNQAESETRRVVNQITGDILAAQSLIVNTGGWPAISVLSNAAPRQGNALQLNLEVSAAGVPTRWILYEVDTTDRLLYRSDTSGSQDVICGPVTNALPFMLVNSLPLTNAMVATGGRTNDAMSSLVQVRLQLAEVGGEDAIVNLGAASFQGNEIRFIVAHRNSNVLRN